MRVPLPTLLIIACLVLGGLAIVPGATAAPAVTSISPSSGTENGNTNITITGTGFSAGALVCLHSGAWTGSCSAADKAQQTIVGSCSGTSTCTITAKTPSRSGVVTATPVTVTVRNLDGQTTSETNGFTYNNVAAPTLTGVAPNSGTSNGGTTLTLKGTGFEANKARPSVAFGTELAPVVTVVDTTTLTVVTPAKVGGGSSDITVTYPSGTDTLTSNFVYTPAPQPTVTSVSPTSGGTNGGNRVTVSGTNFAPGATVCFASLTSNACPAGRSGTQVVFTSTTTLTTLVPARASPGAVDVTVVNPDGKSKTLSSGYSYALAAAPTVGSIVPTFGPSQGGTVIAVAGANFSPGAVMCTSDPATSCGTEIKPTETPGAAGATCPAAACFPVPPGTAGGSATFWIKNPDGQNVETPSFFYRAAVLIKSLSPKTGPANGGTTVDLTGAEFDCGASGLPTVEFDGKPAVSVVAGACGSNDKTTTLTVVTPGHAAGTIDVRVRNPTGLVAQVHAGFTFTASTAPAITSVTSPATHTNGVTYDITVNGASFGCPASLTVGPLPTVTVGTTVVAPANMTQCTASQIVFHAPARAPGSAPIKVKNPSGQESATSPFTYTAAAPSISSLSSAASHPANGGTALTINGAGFSCGAGGQPKVLFGTTPAFSVTPGTCTLGSTGWTTGTLAVVSPGHAAGAVQVKVTNPSTESTPKTPSDAFTYDALPAAPTVSGVSPNAGDSLGNQSRTVSGNNFACTAGPLPTVSFGGSIVPVVDIVTCSSTAITVLTPPHAIGPVDVVVTNPSGQAGPGTNAFTFTTSNAQPVVSGLSATRGTTLGGTLVTISGPDRFYCDPDGPKARVLIGDTVVPAADVTPGACVAGRTDELTVRTPAHGAGPASVIVINPDGQQGSQNGGFLYLALPTITGVTPASGSNLGGPLISVKGANHLVGATVLFTQGAVTKASTIVAVPAEGASSETRAKTPSGDSGAADVTYVGPHGQSATLASGYTYTQTAGPTATALRLAGQPNASPQGPVSGQTTVEISGANIGSGAIVCFGPLSDNVCPPDLRNVGATTVSADGIKLTAVTPSHSLGIVDVIVINPDGQPSSPIFQAFAFLGIDQFPLPTITTVSPSSGPATGGTVVTINGTNLASDAKVKFGATNATSVQFVSPTSILATTPAHGSGVVDVVVTVGSQLATKVGGFSFQSPDAVGNTTPTPTSTSSPTTLPSTGPTLLTPTAIKNANDRIQVTVTRDGEDNVITWDLPNPPAGQTIMGVQVWRSNSPYTLLQTIPSSSNAFKDGTYRDSSSEAKTTSNYLVTMYYGSTAALGLFTASTAPDTDDYPGVASTDSTASGGGGGNDLPTWAIVLIALGILFLVVLVAVLIARGRNRDGQQASAQGYAWQEEGEAKAAEGEWQPPAEVHQARCPACATSFTATGQKPIVTVCPGCGKKGILR
ncbi:MAG TPA: IPT/TIG domain-containing protein [Candidatus Thermoplasmatota archaeon]|nr:IPT/TIG domain-containing protein [Candidatus Thermoplasmatota archaeon]